MSRSARLTLAFVCALCAALIAMPTTAMADEPEVTRAQWIHKIVDTFDVTIEQAVYPEEYFTDISEDDPYYEDFVLALEFGIIDEPLGGEVRPTDAATRDFAAHTLNYCLGYQLQEEGYTFSDSAECTYPDDDQVAVNRSWFALSSGKFNPAQPVTGAEMTAAFEDADQVWNSIDIDENHQDVVQPASGIKVIPDGTTVAQTSTVTYQVTDCPTAIAAGDTFVAYFGGLPNSFTASRVTSLGNVTTITVSEVGVEDAFSNIDCEGVTHIDLSADGYSTVGKMSVRSLRAQSIQFPSFAVTPGSDGRSLTAKASAGAKGDTANGYVDASVSLSNLDLNYNVKRDSAVVYVSGSMDARIGIGGSWDVTVPIKTVPIAGVGSVKLELIQKLNGEAYAGMGATFKAGFQVDTGGDVRLIKEFNKKTPTIRAMVQLTQDLKLSANINLAVAKGSVWAKIGTFTKAEVVSYASGTPETCASISQCLTASAGAEASINLIVWKKEWSKTHTIWDMSNSPVKMYFHYEDGKLVDKCTRDAASDSGGSMSSSSKTAYNYGGGGVLSDTSSGLYSANYSVSANALSLNQDMTILGNLLVKNDVFLNGYTLTIRGNLIQSSHNIDVGTGELDVAGDYRVQYRSTNSAGEPSYSSTRGCLYMRDPAATVRVGGDFCFQSDYSHSSYLTAGTMYVAGDFSDLSGGFTPGGNSSNTHRVVLTKGGTLSIRQEATAGYSSEFCYLDIPNASSVAWNGRMSVLKPMGRDLSVSTTTGLTVQHFNTSGHDLSFTGDVSVGSWGLAMGGGTLAFDRGLAASGDIGMGAGGTMTVPGDLIQSSGTISLGSKLTVTGTMVQGGSVDVGTGELDVAGDYRVQYRSTNSAGEPSYSSTRGCLYMRDPAATVRVGGDFCFQSDYSHSSYLTAGTMYVAGDFSDLSGGFTPGGNSSNTHRVVLNGDGYQTVSMTGSSSKFRILQLMQGREMYVISPDNCWNTLVGSDYVDPRFLPIVTAVLMSPKSAVLAPGDPQDFSATVFGLNGVTQDVTWSLSGKESSGTAITPDGKLTIGDDETADEITVIATPTSDPSKVGRATVTVKRIDVSLAVTKVTLTAGSTYTFNATVYGTNGVSQNVAWSLAGAKSSGTSISTQGVLTVAEDEPSGTLTVTATSVDDPTGTAEVAVTVKGQASNDEKAAEAIAEQIAAIPATESLTLEDAATVAAARTSYNSLTDDQKALVPNDVLAVLAAAEAKIQELQDAANKAQADAAAASGVTQMITALPQVSDIKLSDEAAVVAARNAYDALTPDQKALISTEELGTLTAAEAKIQELKDASGTDDSKPLTVSAKNARYTYDGKAHGGITATVSDSAATILYGKNDGEYTYDKCPEFTDAGTHTVYVMARRPKASSLGTHSLSLVAYSSGGKYAVASTPLTASAAGEGDYDYAYTSATVTIDRRTVENASIELSGTSFTYTGKAQKPTATVKVGGTTLISGTDYIISYKDNVNVGTATVTVTGKGNYKGAKSATFKINAGSSPKVSLSKATITGLKAKTYTGKALTQMPVVKVGVKTLKNGTDYTVSYRNNKNAGTATVIIAGKGNYTGTKSATFRINKAKQPMTAKAVNKTAKVKTLKKKTVTLTKTVTVKKRQGTLSFKNVSIQKAAKKFKVNAKKGMITVPKGTKKGTYSVKVKVTAKGSANYASGSKTVTVKISVK